ncbi:MAG TPA: hypothetical protein PKD64_13220 [Pirellulaceae bacterium]|mgnify:CR=1 FL=1|nr:hypothetical protein [Pirellulaceae bacterium]HMO93147.1 hypothetical protein [Pirellulaceae bacterium]HMP70023.1 hypothetical protein [Pirellulaceae bacterium]
MKANESKLGMKALVTIFEDLPTAEAVIKQLCESGFSPDKLELVTHDVKTESPEMQTPKVHETTGTSLVDSAAKWGGTGFGTGLLAGLFTGNPILAGGMAAIGGMTGMIVGGMAGVEHAVEDDSVNLPTLSEYEQMVRRGRCLVVALGSHDEVMRAKAIMNEFPNLHYHMHLLHGHEFHEHPTNTDQ